MSRSALDSRGFGDHGNGFGLMQVVRNGVVIGETAAVGDNCSLLHAVTLLCGLLAVTELMVIERYSHVMHIVSNVTGALLLVSTGRLLGVIPHAGAGFSVEAIDTNTSISDEGTASLMAGMHEFRARTEGESAVDYALSSVITGR